MTEENKAPAMKPASLHIIDWEEASSLVTITSIKADRICLLVELVPGARVLWSVCCDATADLPWQKVAANQFSSAATALLTDKTPTWSSDILPLCIEGGSPCARLESGKTVRYTDCFGEQDDIEVNGHIFEIPVDRFKLILRTCSELISAAAVTFRVAIVSPHIVRALNELGSFVTEKDNSIPISHKMLDVAIRAAEDDCPLHKEIDSTSPEADLRYILEIIGASTSYASKPDCILIAKYVAAGIINGFGRPAKPVCD